MKITLISYLLISLSLNCFGKELASSKEILEFQESALIIPNKLLELGYSNFGRLNLQEVINNAKDITVKSKEWLIVTLPDGSERISGYWYNSGDRNGVDFNLKVWKMTFNFTKPLIALHEFLCALGFDDEHYHLSLSLWFLSEQKKKNYLNSNDFREVENNIELLASGGIIGVGGGGDFGSLALMQFTLSEVEEKITFEALPKDHLMKMYRFFTSMKNLEIQWIQK